MRLTCPNCGAQYAVDSRVIPETGRDVQCSNCGKTWFQHHPDYPPAPEAPVEEPEIAAPPPEPEPEPTSVAPAPAPTEAPEPAEEVPDPALGPAVSAFDAFSDNAAPADEPDLPADVPPEDEDADGETQETPPVPPRRPVDEAAMAVLREEAAREQAARNEERVGLESQGELDMAAPDDSLRRPEPDLAPRAPARVVPSDTIPAERKERDETPAPRRERLPDVEEISSTLRPEEVAAAQKAESRVSREARTRGRRIGLGIAFFLFGCAALLYSQHKAVEGKFPQAAPVLEQYVASIDAARIQLDSALRASVTKLKGSDK